MVINKNQYDKLPDKYKQYFERKVGGMGEQRKNVHPTLSNLHH